MKRDDGRRAAFPDGVVDAGTDLATVKEKYLKQSTMSVFVDMPVVYPAAGFYQLDVHEFGIVTPCLLAVQAKLWNVVEGWSGGTGHGGACRSKEWSVEIVQVLGSFIHFFCKAPALRWLHTNTITETSCVPR